MVCTSVPSFLLVGSVRDLQGSEVRCSFKNQPKKRHYSVESFDCTLFYV